MFQPLANLFEGMGKNMEKLLAMKSETTEPSRNRTGHIEYYSVVVNYC